jgi:protoheme IX farnesyltransferase
MKAGAISCSPDVVSAGRIRAADFVELTKPRIALLALATVVVGAFLASGGAPAPGLLLHVLLGVAFVAGGASALNQLFEHDVDRLMQRTCHRPLPSGRLKPLEVGWFGAALGITGAVYLAVTVNSLTALLAVFTFCTYVFLYTPLKRRTSLNTVVGAVPGALPPVLGWTAVRGTLDIEAGALFLIVFLWQFPHFLAIAWIHRADYSRAGLKMLPTLDACGRLTGRQMVVYSLALLPVSLLPSIMGLVGVYYFFGALILGTTLLASAIAFSLFDKNVQARQLLRVSLIYLPGLLALLMFDLPSW